MTTIRRFTVIALACLFLFGPAISHSQDATTSEAAAAPATAPEGAPSPEEQAAYERLVALDRSLQYATGSVVIGDDLATLNLAEGLRYLEPASTEKLLVEGWGNPEGSGTLGMILPSDTSPLSGEGWGVIISYDEEGYVSDEDADGIDYDTMMKDMQASTVEENEARASQGYERVELVGWADRPLYEKDTHKLFWAKELAFEGMTSHTLNYNVRVLGRRGVLVLNAVAGMDQLELIQAAMPAVIAAADFNPGNRYADYQPGGDKIAAYGLAALVAGGIATKSGLLAKGLALVLAAKKLLIPAAIALLAGGRAWMKRRNGSQQSTPPTTIRS